VSDTGQFREGLQKNFMIGVLRDRENGGSNISIWSVQIALLCCALIWPRLRRCNMHWALNGRRNLTSIQSIFFTQICSHPLFLNCDQTFFSTFCITRDLNIKNLHTAFCYKYYKYDTLWLYIGIWLKGILALMRTNSFQIVSFLKAK